MPDGDEFGNPRSLLCPQDIQRVGPVGGSPPFTVPGAGCARTQLPAQDGSGWWLAELLTHALLPFSTYRDRPVLLDNLGFPKVRDKGGIRRWS